MILVSDVHGAGKALANAVSPDEPVVVLGDLVNLIDYRTGDGIVADVVGADVVIEIAALRAARRSFEANALWKSVTADRQDDIQSAVADGMRNEYQSVLAGLDGVEAYVTYGNADDPAMLAELLPPSATFVDGVVIEIEGLRVGFAGGGGPRLGTPGEVSAKDMAAKLAALGPTDVLCTHLPPNVPELATDVIGRTRKGSSEILAYLLEYRPRFHYFGDIHQPRAVSWTVGRTRCVNVGYFRATGRVFRHG